MESRNQSESFGSAKIILSIVAVAMLIYDIWYCWLLANGDPFKHIPFLYPVVLAFFVGIMEVIDRHARRLTPVELTVVREQTRRESAFAPENLPVERAAEGHIE